MGKRGPAPKPTALRVLHGDRRDRINDQEPVPPDGEIVPPEEISPDARQVWERLAPSLIACGVLTAWDVDAFWMACEALARYRQATRLVNGSALLVQGPNGLTKNPALVVQREAETSFAHYGARFGLTPSDRSQLKIDPAGGGGKARGAERLLS